MVSKFKSQELRANAANLHNPALYSEFDTISILDNPLKYALEAVSIADTMYFHEAMKAPDSDKFKESMVFEVKQHIKKDTGFQFGRPAYLKVQSFSLQSGQCVKNARLILKKSTNGIAG
jgi:hypothetical protein